jgi:hypothetical protein
VQLAADREMRALLGTPDALERSAEFALRLARPA